MKHHGKYFWIFVQTYFDGPINLHYSFHLIYFNFKKLQKQPFRGVLRKRCSEKRQQIYRKDCTKNEVFH